MPRKNKNDSPQAVRYIELNGTNNIVDETDTHFRMKALSWRDSLAMYSDIESIVQG